MLPAEKTGMCIAMIVARGWRQDHNLGANSH